MADNDCLFCRIAAGEIPARVAYEDNDVFAFHDVSPQAPTHVLIIPRRHIRSAAELSAEDGPLLGGMLAAATRIAEQEGVAGSGYRLVTNVGKAAGQSVDHLHVHLLGGRSLSWPPG